MGVLVTGPWPMSHPPRYLSAPTLQREPIYEAIQLPRQDEPTPTCASWLKKPKVIKKLKRKIGLGTPIPSCPVNLPRLSFSHVHGENVSITCDGVGARRMNGFCKAVAFSARPLAPSERVFIKVEDVSRNWNGSLRFGVTCNDPSNLKPERLPKYAVPDLTSRPGYWAKALEKMSLEKGETLFYYVTLNGEIRYGIDGIEKGVALEGVDMRAPLWCLFDIYGNTTSIRFVDPRAHLNNSRTSLAQELNQQQFREVNSPFSSSHSFGPQANSTPNNSRHSSQMFQNSDPRCSPINRSIVNRPSSISIPMSTPTNQPQMNPAYTFISNYCSGSSSSTLPRCVSAPHFQNGNGPIKKGNDGFQGSDVVNNHNYSQASTSSTIGPRLPPRPPNFSAGIGGGIYGNNSKKDLGWNVECVACCERSVDSVFYSCGHMCMCYPCGLEYWKRKDDNGCPICRAPISDLIRTYKS